ncbi:MAG TPA: hypothetical protein PK001_06325, partial [Dokdonella sp.]
AHLSLPLLGDLHVPSATLFDMAVLAVVVGSTLLILTALAHQSLRTQQASTSPSPVMRSREDA